MGPLLPSVYEAVLQQSELYRKYQEKIDPVSAYELLTQRVNNIQQENIQQEEQKTHTTRAKEKSTMEQVFNAPITRQIGREIVRGLFGILTGKKTRTRKGGLFGF
jgi:hypothetical protein